MMIMIIGPVFAQGEHSACPDPYYEGGIGTFLKLNNCCVNKKTLGNRVCIIYD
jgi:hypothetical protein